MKIAVLTSSRADYGIYQPLLRRLENDTDFDLQLIVFGTHLSRQHGYTIDQIHEDGYRIAAEVESLVQGDSEEAISTAMALTSMKFAGLWKIFSNSFDLVFCLGDRYEMYAAVSASIPFNISFAHIHGGEKTLGAIDNTFRHCLSLMCRYHFTTTRQYADRVRQLLDDPDNATVHNVGSLSLDNLSDIKLLSKEQFRNKYDIDLNQPTALFTWHPETVNVTHNIRDLDVILQSLDFLDDYQIVITMPNADTMGERVKQKLQFYFERNRERVVVVESFGTLGYFSCMEHASFLMGNSSSGIIEAASFGKYVLNIGNRQKGRATGKNVIHVEPKLEQILTSVEKIEQSKSPGRENIYYQGGAADKILEILRKISLTK